MPYNGYILVGEGSLLTIFADTVLGEAVVCPTKM